MGEIEWVLQKTGEIQTLLNNIRKRKLRFLGQAARSDGLSKDLLFETVPRKRKRGRPKTRS